MKNTDNNKDEKQALYDLLVKEVKERVQKLKEYGMNEQEITSLIHTDQPILTLTISKNNRIFLGNKRVEVHMEPLVKAVYLLFLKHPEGVIFKDLPDYRQELTKIYSEVRPWGLTDRALQSIEDVTNPLLNSINEKCARIRKTFVNALDSKGAEPYIIKGMRGGIKKNQETYPYAYYVHDSYNISFYNDNEDDKLQLHFTTIEEVSLFYMGWIQN